MDNDVAAKGDGGVSIAIRLIDSIAVLVGWRIVFLEDVALWVSENAIRVGEKAARCRLPEETSA